MYKSVTDIKPNYINDIANALRSVAYSVGATMHPEFMRAIKSVAVAYGITENELRNGSNRTGRPNFKEDITAVLKSVRSAAGREIHPEFLRALVAIGLQFGIGSGEIENAA